MKELVISESDVPTLAAAAINHYEHTLQELQTDLVQLTAHLQLRRAIHIGRSLGLKITQTPKRPRPVLLPSPGYSAYFKDLVVCVILQEPKVSRPHVLKRLSEELKLSKELLRHWVKEAVKAEE